MTDFAALGIKIDSSQARQATKDLESLAAVGDKVASSIADTENATRKLERTLSAGAKAARDNSNSIDKVVQGLQKVAATNGLSAREAKLYDLALQGATKSQLAAADAAIRLDEGYKRGLAIGQRVREGIISTAASAVKLGAALGVAAAGGAVLFNRIAGGIANYQGLSEKIGDTASSIASLQGASDTSEVSLDSVAAASIRLTSALSKTDDESKLVAKGIKALGLNFDDFKKLSPVDQLDAVAKAMSGFAEGSEKTAAAVAIFGKSGAELIPFLNDLADAGERQIRLSDEQIKAADEHTKAQARLKSEITSLSQVIVSQSLPAVTDLTAAFKDTIAQAVGLDKGASDLARNGGIQQFAEEGAVFLATLADYAVKTGEAFVGLGKTIGGVAAIQISLAKADFQAAWNIGKELINDSKSMFSAPSIADALRQRQQQRRTDESQRGKEERGFTPSKPRIDAAGLNTDRTPKGRKDNSAAQEAKAQLAFDLEDIRKAQDALTNTIANGEKMLEAKRSANLVTEEAYWDQKKQFLIENNQAQQQGLSQELARLEQEKLSGKDAIDNARKILDVEAKLAKARQDGATNLQVLEIRQADALNKIAAKWELAEKAAQSYVDTIARANDREIAGLGRGNLNREIDARRNQRDDQFQNRKDQLFSQFREGQISEPDYNRFLKIEADAHAKSLSADERYWKQKIAIQQDGVRGAQEGLQNYIDEANNAYERGNRLVTDGLRGFNESLTESLWNRDLSSFKDYGERMGKQILSGILEQQITGPIAQWLQNSLKDPESGIGSLIGGLTGTSKTGENWLGSLLGTSPGGGTGAATAAASTTALATSATTATASITALAAAATAAATAMGGSSLSGAMSLANSVGSSGGDALGSLISSMGWAEGGYTGDGGKYQPAGIVHAGEYVVNAENTRRLGVSFLERLNRRGYAEGGYVSSIVGGSLASPQAGQAGGNVNNYHVDVHGQVDHRTRTQIANDLSLVQRRAGRMQ